MSELVITVSPIVEEGRDQDPCIICSTTIPPLLNKSGDFEGCECKNTFFHSQCYEEYRKNFVNCPTCRRKMIGLAEEFNPHNPRIRGSILGKVITWILWLGVIAFNLFILVLAGLSASLEDPPSNIARFIVSGTMLAYIPEIFKNCVYLFANRFGDRYIAFFEKSITYKIVAVVWIILELFALITKFGYPQDIEGTYYLFMLTSILAYRCIVTLSFVAIFLGVMCVSVCRG